VQDALQVVKAMGFVERRMMEAIIRLIEAEAAGVTEEQVLSAVIPPEHPEYRLRPSYAYGFRRLAIRGLLSAVRDQSGGWVYRPTEKAIRELDRGESNAYPGSAG
jgi:hypothetical protein